MKSSKKKNKENPNKISTISIKKNKKAILMNYQK